MAPPPDSAPDITPDSDGIAAGLDDARTAAAGSGNPPVRALLVGCGGISATWLGAIERLPDVELVGLVDLDEAQARHRAEAFELTVPIGTELATMIRRLEPDVVFDCTVPEAHHGVTLTALEAGCHVFGEKPMAEHLEQARLAVRASRDAGRIYAVMQNRRYDPNIRRLRSFLDSGVLGTITTVNADFYLGARFGGFRDHMAHVLLKDMAIHTFDAARFLTDRNPEAVYCHEWNPQGSWYDSDASAMAIFELEGGVVFNYRGSWCAEGLATSWESSWRIVGTRGSVSWDGADGFKVQTVADASGFRSSYHDLELPSCTRQGHQGRPSGCHRRLRGSAAARRRARDDLQRQHLQPGDGAGRGGERREATAGRSHALKSVAAATSVYSYAMRSWSALLPAGVLLAGCLLLTAVVLTGSQRQAAANARIIELQTLGGKTRVTVNTWLERATFGRYRRGNAVSSDDVEDLRQLGSRAARTVSLASLGLLLAGTLFLLTGLGGPARRGGAADAAVFRGTADSRPAGADAVAENVP